MPKNDGRFWFFRIWRVYHIAGLNNRRVFCVSWKWWMVMMMMMMMMMMMFTFGAKSCEFRLTCLPKQDYPKLYFYHFNSKSSTFINFILPHICQIFLWQELADHHLLIIATRGPISKKSALTLKQSRCSRTRNHGSGGSHRLSLIGRNYGYLDMLTIRISNLVYSYALPDKSWQIGFLQSWGSHL